MAWTVDVQNDTVLVAWLEPGHRATVELGAQRSFRRTDIGLLGVPDEDREPRLRGLRVGQLGALRQQ
jgi:hypothetical protein